MDGEGDERATTLAASHRLERGRDVVERDPVGDRGREVESRTAGSSVFSYSVELEPRGKMRLLRPILGPMVRSNLRKDLQKLKTLLEAG